MTGHVAKTTDRKMPSASGAARCVMYVSNIVLGKSYGVFSVAVSSHSLFILRRAQISLGVLVLPKPTSWQT